MFNAQMRKCSVKKQCMNKKNILKPKKTYVQHCTLTQLGVAYKFSRTCTCSFILSLKVDGNIFGNNLRNTGSKNSMNGTMIKTAKGTSRKMSAVVRVSCCLSLLERLFPSASFNNNLELILISAQRSLVPNQQCCIVDLNSSFQ